MGLAARMAPQSTGVRTIHDGGVEDVSGKKKLVLLSRVYCRDARQCFDEDPLSRDHPTVC